MKCSGIRLILKSKKIFVSLVLFTLCWTFYGTMVNSSEVRSYGLYQYVTEAIVDYGTFQIGFSQIPEFRDGLGDIYSYEGKRFPAKQPGIFVLNSIPYWALKKFGFNYVDHYETIAGVGAWVVTGFLVALSVSCLFCLLLDLTKSYANSIASALIYGLGTGILPYTGVVHHDGAATALLVIGLTMLLDENRNRFFICLGGFCMGFILFLSMLPALIVAFVLGAITFLKQRSIVCMALGFGLGVSPLLIFNTYYFGNPLIQGNVAGSYKDTFFNPSFPLAWDHFKVYFGSGWISVLKFQPIYLFGIVGLLLAPRKVQIITFPALVFHWIYVLNIETIGGCQFGPRYLLPTLPLIALGFPFVLANRTLRLWTVVFAIYSVGVNVLGALGSTMYCGWEEVAISRFWRDLRHLQLEPRPVFKLSVTVGLILFGLVMLWAYRDRDVLFPRKEV